MGLINFLLQAWDKPFVDKMANYPMQSLLSTGNIPALAQDHELRFLLYTDRSSQTYLRERALALEAFGEVSVSLFEETNVDGATILDATASISQTAQAEKHNIDRLCQFSALDRTVQDGEGAVLFIIPQDAFISDGSVSSVYSMIEEGAEMVGVPTIRLSMETCRLTPEVIKARGEAGFTAREIVKEMPRNLHRVTRSLIADSNQFTQYPASIFWPADSLGWICRSFFPMPLAVRPNPKKLRFESTMDYEFGLQMVSAPELYRIPHSSDEAFLCKVTTDEYLDKIENPMELTRNRLAHFILVETNKAHRALLDQAYRLIKDDASHCLWAQLEAETKSKLDEVYGFVEALSNDLPDSPQLQAVKDSHFGTIDQYRSPGRRIQ